MSRAGTDIDGNVGRYLAGRSDTARYSSFDYCNNYFASFRDAGRTAALADPAHLQMSCLQLGFYLASWGMFRGRAELLSHSAKRLAPVIDAIVAAPAPMWTVDAGGYDTEGQRLLFDVERSLRHALPGGRSTTLVTKTMLGVFGCVPAYDRFFRTGFGVTTFGRKSLAAINEYYLANAKTIDRLRVPTLDFTTGAETARTYTRAKVIDMAFFIEGAGLGSSPFDGVMP